MRVKIIEELTFEELIRGTIPTTSKLDGLINNFIDKYIGWEPVTLVPGS